MTADSQLAERCSPGRKIELDRCPNFRDLGGYAAADGRRVRWRQLFRSMTPEYLSLSEVQALKSLRIHLIIDLRGRNADSSGPLAAPPVRRLRLGHPRMLASSRAQLMEYANLKPEDALPVVLSRLGRVYAKAASAIANETEPTLVHCRLGKDRTGVFAAVILKALGVQDDDVVADYMLSESNLDACHQVLAKYEPSTSSTNSRVAREAPSREGIQRVLGLLKERYGGGVNYLTFHGMRKRDITALQERLLEPVGSV